MRAFMLSIFLLMVFFAGQAAASDPATDARKVIGNQILAFLNADADAAYGYASPAIKEKFPDKTTFFDMVKRTYKPVYEPGNYAFGRDKVEDDGTTVFQEVLITGRDGKDWTAIYQLQRQADSTYRINGVQLFPNKTSNGI